MGGVLGCQNNGTPGQGPFPVSEGTVLREGVKDVGQILQNFNQVRDRGVIFDSSLCHHPPTSLMSNETLLLLLSKHFLVASLFPF